MEQDHPPEADTYGLVLMPSDPAFVLDDKDKAKDTRPWRDVPDNHLVNRDTQVWWPGSRNNPGFGGRWGVMSQNDPYDRRSGIEFPNFKRAFLIDLAIRMSS
jgi:hypothetical protein